MAQRAHVPDRVSEMDMLKLEWKQRKSEEDAMLNECIALHTSHLDGKGDGEMRKGAELVAPIPSFSSVAEATRHAAGTTNGQDSATRHDYSVRFPMRTIWQIRRNGDISIHDAPSGTKLHTLRRLKGDVRPSIVRHVPHCSVIPLVDGKTPAIVYGSALARHRALEKQLLAAPALRVCDVDFVWIGFVDGSIRLVSSEGYPIASTNHAAKKQRQESDCFLVHELSKCHSSEVVAIELSPYHTAREFPKRDLRDHGDATTATTAASLTELKHILVASDVQPPDRHVSYVCTASTDSCVVVWDLVEVYTAVNKLMESQRELERASQRGMKLGAKGPRFPSDHVRGCTRGTAAIYFETHQFTEADSMTLVSYCTQVSVRPVMKLKGSVSGLRHLRWVSTIVTTDGYRFHRFFDNDADVGDSNGEDGRNADPLNPYRPDAEEQHALSNMRQAHTRQDSRAHRMLELGLSEADMLAAESELQGRRFPVEKEPVASKCVHLLVAGDSNGYVMLWNLDEELHRCTFLTPPTPNELSLHVGKRGNSPTRLRSDADVRSLASHITSTSHYLRATDKRIQFSGGVSISGIEPSLPPVIHITTRRAEPNHRSGRAVYNAAGQELVDDPMVNEFMPLTDALALFHMYEHLELFVAVDGAVQFLSCHPAFLSLESEEQIHLLMDQRRRNLIEAKRGVDDEVVGSLEFQGFSVFFSKRVLEYHSQPVTAMRLDAAHHELWVARHDGMISCFSTTGLKVIARIPHPHSNATIAPPTADEVEQGLADYHFLAGLPTHLEVHKECTDLPASYLTAMVPTDTEKDPLLLCCFGKDSRAITQWAVLSSCTPKVCSAAQRSMDVLVDRLAVAWTFQRRRSAERRNERSEARQAYRVAQQLLGIVRSACDTRSATATRFRCLLRWGLFVRHRRTARAANHWYELENGAAQRKRRYMEHLYAAATQDRVVRKQQLVELASALASNSGRRVLQSVFTRWMQHSACSSPAKKSSSIAQRSNERRLLSRYLLQWMGFVQQFHLSIRNTHVNARFQLHLPVVTLRDVGLQALLRWQLWAISRGERARLQFANELRCAAITDACAAGVVRMRCFSKWRQFSNLRRLVRQLKRQTAQLGEYMLAQRLHLALHVQHEQRRDNDDDGGVSFMNAFNVPVPPVESYDDAVGDCLLAEHFVEASTLLTSCFSVTVVDPADTTGRSLHDVMHASQEGCEEDSTSPLTAALSRVASELSTREANVSEQGAALLAAEEELRFVEQTSIASEVPDSFALVAAKCAAWQRGQSVECMFDTAVRHRERLHEFLHENGISLENLTHDVDTTVVTVLNGFVAPLLEVPNSLSSAASVGWDAVTVAFEFLRGLENLEAPGYYFSLATALTERSSDLERFHRAIRDIEEQPLSESD